MDKKQILRLKVMFDNIVHKTDEGMEYWLARELQIILGYKKWDKFQNVIKKAQSDCENSGNLIADHFLQTGKMVEIGSGASRDIQDIMLTRYACYLIAQNGDSLKEEKLLLTSKIELHFQKISLKVKFFTN